MGKLKRADILAPGETAMRWRITDALAMILTLGVVVARAMMLESLRDPGGVMPGQVAPPSAPGAGTSMVMSLLACAPAMLVLARRAWDPGYRFARAWSHYFAAALAVWAGASVFWSADKFAALVGACTFMSAVVLIWSTAQLVRDWRRMRLVAGVCMGLLLVYAVQGVGYLKFDLPVLVERWDQDIDGFRSNLYRERGWSADDFAAKRFDMKLRAGEMAGFNASANTFAAVSIMLAVVMAGYCIQRGRQREYGALVVPAIALAIVGWLLIYTQSKTALVTPVVAVVLFAMVALWRGRIGRNLPGMPNRLRRSLGVTLSPVPGGEGRVRGGLASDDESSNLRPSPQPSPPGTGERGNATSALEEPDSHHHRLLFILGLSVVLLVVAGVVGYGLKHDSLLIDSLTFRWQYWIASLRMFFDHPILGVGYANFGDYYTAYRLPVAAEEIRDPHNLFVRLFTELGLVGGVLSMAWMGTLWWSMTSSSLPRAPERDEEGRGWILTAALVVIAGMILQTLASVDFLQDENYVLIELLKRGLYLLLLAVGIMLSMTRMVGGQFRLDDRPAPWLVVGAIIAIAVFLLHALIDFAFFEAGPMFLFALLVGSVLGMRASRSDSPKTPPSPLASSRLLLIPATLAFIAALIVTSMILIAESRAADGDALLRANHPDQSVVQYRAAFSTVPFNADYAHRAAEALVVTRAPLNDVNDAIAGELSANPRASGAHLLRARYWREVKPTDPQAPVADYARAIELNPQEIDLRIEYARALADAGRNQDALKQANAAMAVNNAYRPDEPERLSPDRFEELKTFITQLEFSGAN